jgi:protease IV
VSRRSAATTLVVAFVALLALAGLVLAVVHAVRGDAGIGTGGRIAVLEIDGIITEDQQFLRELRRFRDNSSVRGYVVSINSPGGVVAPSQSIFQELRRIREEDQVPVVAAIGGVGASGGYYVALAADSIFALPGSITGSIGVIMEIPDVSELMGRVGVRVNSVMSARHKDAGSPFRPLDDADRQVLESLVADVYDQFVEAVAAERNLDRTAVLQYADGRILSGRQALQARLVDRLGNREDALATAGRMAGLGDRPRVIRPPEPRVTVFDLLFGRNALAALDRLTSPLKPAVPAVQYIVPW